MPHRRQLNAGILVGAALAGGAVLASSARAGAVLPEGPWAASHRTGPPPGHTGGFGEPTCQICHEGDDLNAFGGQVTLRGLPEAWEPGRTYALSVVLEMEETSVAGFQLSARFGDGVRASEPAGTLTAVGPGVAVTRVETGQVYAHHTEVGTEPPNPSGATWQLQWTAPSGAAAPGSGAPPAVAFHVAANSGNGDNSPLLDLIYTSEVVVPPKN